MSSPTNRKILSRSQKRLRCGETAIAGARRPKAEAPEMYVKTRGSELFPRYHRAHLRNRGGYLYLGWREGARVRTWYLGKAAKSSPTLSPAELQDLVDLAGLGAGARARACRT